MPIVQEYEPGKIVVWVKLTDKDEDIKKALEELKKKGYTVIGKFTAYDIEETNPELHLEMHFAGVNAGILLQKK
jgi:HSP20 family molecular chaperone IbpA